MIGTLKNRELSGSWRRRFQTRNVGESAAFLSFPTRPDAARLVTANIVSSSQISSFQRQGILLRSNPVCQAGFAPTLSRPKSCIKTTGTCPRQPVSLSPPDTTSLPADFFFLSTRFALGFKLVSITVVPPPGAAFLVSFLVLPHSPTNDEFPTPHSQVAL